MRVKKKYSRVMQKKKNPENKTSKSVIRYPDDLIRNYSFEYKAAQLNLSGPWENMAVH